jgi:hypothetical protein
VEPEGQKPSNPVINMLTADAQGLAEDGLAWIAVAVFVDIRRQATEGFPQLVRQRGEESRIARIEVHFDEHPPLAVARRDVNLGLEFDRNERLTLRIVRLRVHAQRRELAESQSETLLTQSRKQRHGTWTISTWDARAPTALTAEWSRLLLVRTFQCRLTGCPAKLEDLANDTGRSATNT